MHGPLPYVQITIPAAPAGSAVLGDVAALGLPAIAGASEGGGTNSLLLTLGVSLLAEAAIVAPRALGTGVALRFGYQNVRSRHGTAHSAGAAWADSRKSNRA